MKIVVLDGYTLNPGDLSWSGLEDLGEVTLYDRTPKGEIIQRIEDAEVVITNKTPLSEEVFTNCPKIKYVGVLATGYNVVDIEAAKSNGVVVTNIPTYGTTAVGQFVFALLLELCHHVGDHSSAVKSGDWGSSKDFCFWNYPLVELADKTFGILGFGRIGQNAAKVAQGFGMKVIAYDPTMEIGETVAGATTVSLDTLFVESDVISLHCPLFPETEGIINKDSISKMKDGVKIINTSRGPLIKECDLAEALNSGKVSGAAVDVLAVEPPKGLNTLMKAKNCIVTPHIAWAPKESRSRLMDIAVANLKDFLNGSPVNVVNP